MSVKKHIPNAITSLNLLCGVIGIWFTLALNDCTTGFYFMLLAVVFDYADGLVARLLGAYSEIGKELDSLSDMVSFGVLPALMMVCTYLTLPSHLNALAWIPLLIAAFSAFRLARFNIDERQHSSFIGLPTPAAALLCASLCCLIGQGRIGGLFLSVWFIPALSLVMSALLVSPVPMFAFKFGKEIESDPVTKMKRYAIVSICIIVLVLVVLFRMPWQSFIFGAFSIYIIANLIFAAFKI